MNLPEPSPTPENLHEVIDPDEYLTFDQLADYINE